MSKTIYFNFFEVLWYKKRTFWIWIFFFRLSAVICGEFVSVIVKWRWVCLIVALLYTFFFRMKTSAIISTTLASISVKTDFLSWFLYKPSILPVMDNVYFYIRLLQNRNCQCVFFLIEKLERIQKKNRNQFLENSITILPTNENQKLFFCDA